ncbi:MAG TPA: hypothetical protein VGC81_10960, partial [Candidatus Methylomirabilis sp.]
MARGAVKSTKSLAARARAQRAKAGREQQSVVSDYGTALGGAIGQAYSPLRQRVQAGVSSAQARVGQARSMAQTAQQSTETHLEGQAAIDAAYAAQQDRVQKSARPQIISAQSAIASAESYAKGIGLDMKKMDATAKASIYQAIISQNAEMFRMQYAQQLEIEGQKQLFELTKQ